VTAKGFQLEPALKMSLERAIEYIAADEYVEATPKKFTPSKENPERHTAQTFRAIAVRRSVA